MYRRFITSLSFLFACGSLAIPLAAQSNTPPSQDSAAWKHRGPHFNLLKGITLSATQQSQVDSIRARYRDSLRTLHNDNTQGGAGQDKQQARSQMRQIMLSQWNDIRSVLTADQQSIFDSNVKRMQQHMQSRPPQGTGT